MPNRVSSATCALVVSLIVSPSATRAAAPPGADPIVERLIAAWKVRESRIQTVKFAINSRKTYLHGSHSMEIDNDELLVDLCSNGDVSWLTRNIYLYDGQRMRLSQEGPVYSGNIRGFRWTERDESFDGKTVISLMDPGTTDGRAAAHVTQARPLSIQLQFSQKPVMTFLHPFEPQFGGIDRADLRVDKLRSVDKQIALRVDHPGSEAASVIVVDPERDYSIVKTVCEHADGVPCLVQSVDYVRDSKYGWVPSHWKTKCFGAVGNEEWNVVCSVEAYEINAVVPAADFEIKLAAGTRVNVLDLSRRFGRRSLIVDPGGMLVPYEE